MTTTQTASSSSSSSKNVLDDKVKRQVRALFATAHSSTFAHERATAIHALRALEVKYGFTYGPAKGLVAPERPAETDAVQTPAAPAPAAAKPEQPKAEKQPKPQKERKARGPRSAVAPDPSPNAVGTWHCKYCDQTKPLGAFRVLSISGRAPYRLQKCKACESSGAKKRAQK